ncbi:MAG TPA: hypothetical protein PLP17_05770, partial [Oligoflexia bacterium]|nr:hypothetical protein [Oligoflexia bacterium]
MSKLLATSSRASGTMLATTDQRRFTRLQCARLLLGLIIVVSLSHVVHFGLSVSWILLGTIAGGVLSGRFLLSGRSFLQTAAAHLLFFCLLAGILALANITVVAQAGSAPQSDFLIPRYADDIFLVCLFYTASFLSTWFFWTNAQAVTFEALFGTSIFVWLLSAHRNYHIDAPKQISSLAWKAEFLQHHQIEPQHLFLGIGALVAAVLVIYFCLASNRPIIGRPAALKSFGKTQSFAALLCILAVLAGFAYYAKYVNTRYSTDLSRVTSGVGMDQNLAEGESNLGFHQAISPTRQPAALLRLENDFKKNPWQPMLYLREGALSAFNGRELVSAGLQFDRDVPKIGIGQPYITAEDELPGASEREKVVQSVYLLTKHTAPFAIDIPQKISVLRNPDPQRFLSAYQVSSFAPTMPAVNLVGKAVGDSSWPEEVWDHYLRAPGSLSPQADLTGALDAEEPVFDV